MFTAPGGTLALTMASASNDTAKGVNSGDLMTTLLPAAKAGANDRATNDTGKFHGIT